MYTFLYCFDSTFSSRLLHVKSEYSASFLRFLTEIQTLEWGFHKSTFNLWLHLSAAFHMNGFSDADPENNRKIKLTSQDPFMAEYVVLFTFITVAASADYQHLKP